MCVRTRTACVFVTDSPGAISCLRGHISGPVIRIASAPDSPGLALSTHLYSKDNVT